MTPKPKKRDENMPVGKLTRIKDDLPSAKELQMTTPQNLPRTEGCGYHSNEPEHFDENCLMCYKKALDLERLRADGLEKELEILNSIHGDVHVAHGEALTRAEVAEKKLSQMDEFAFNIQAKLEEAEKEVGRLKEQINSIPISNNYEANRYETDDEIVLHLWEVNGGGSYDIRFNKETN